MARKRFRNPNIAASGTVRLVRQPVLGAKRMVEARGGLERHPRGEAGPDEADEIGCWWERVRGDAAGADLGPASGRADGGDQRCRIRSKRDLDVRLEIGRHPREQPAHGVGRVGLGLDHVGRHGPGSLRGVATVELADVVDVGGGVAPEQSGDAPGRRRRISRKQVGRGGLELPDPARPASRTGRGPRRAGRSDTRRSSVPRAACPARPAGRARRSRCWSGAGS